MAPPALASVECPSLPFLVVAGVRALCAFPWPSLRTLDLSSCGMGQRGIAALGAAPSAPSLTSLSVAGNPLGCGAAAAPAPPRAQAPAPAPAAVAAAAAAASKDGVSSSGGGPAGVWHTGM